MPGPGYCKMKMSAILATVLGIPTSVGPTHFCSSPRYGSVFNYFLVAVANYDWGWPYGHYLPIP